MSKLYILFITILYHSFAFGQTIDKRNSNIKFQTLYMSVYPVDGTFSDFHGIIVLNEDSLLKSHVDLTFAVKSINTDFEKRDKTLMSEKYFNSEIFPNISFKSSSIKALNDSIFEALGLLTIKGIKRIITIPVKVTDQHFKGEFTLNRLDYSVGSNNTFIVDDEVKISFDCTINK